MLKQQYKDVKEGSLLSDGDFDVDNRTLKVEKNGSVASLLWSHKVKLLVTGFLGGR